MPLLYSTYSIHWNPPCHIVGGLALARLDGTSFSSRRIWFLSQLHSPFATVSTVSSFFRRILEPKPKIGLNP